MTKHIVKSGLPKAPRLAPVFVSRRMACALLDLSPSAFRAWQARGILPPPVVGFDGIFFQKSPFYRHFWQISEIANGPF